jgi:hypothetical protein
MTAQSRLVGTLILIGLMLNPTVAGAQDFLQSRSHVKVLSDHPGAATALTPRQKAEIEELVSKSSGSQIFVCTGISLTGQRESMYRVVLRRAELVCDYVKTLNPALNTIVQQSPTPARNFNGRVVVVGR